MFLKHLNQRQHRLFLSMAKEILSADGIIDETEEIYLRKLCAEMNIEFNEELPLEKNKLSTEFPNKKLHNIVLIELFLLAFSNSNFDINEKLYISDIAKFLEIDESAVSEMENTMKSYTESRTKLLKYINSR